MILRPLGGPENHWISFELQGTKSNRLALNAQVKITDGSLFQMGEVLSSGSYLSQNDLRIHFGLAAATKVDSVEIGWPSGTVDNLKDLSANTFYSVVEGKGIVSAEQMRPVQKKQNR
ncbi:MAG TPA: ASPIC/UnbV domain-containing protein [Candidatus Dormibacteraeota bacterium]|nr:ASPIC/UnbV domain-containing protein [Candidatus Dormibacteraeota bacterium]